MDVQMYAISGLSLREQLRDTYRVLFGPALLALLVAASLWLERWVSAGTIRGMLIAACVGMLPSLAMETPARMPVSVGDRVTIEKWLANHGHARDARGWVPKLPRALYFDSQIVHCDDSSVVGPLVVLRKLRRVLRGNVRTRG